jgi:hypothetical protein
MKNEKNCGTHKGTQIICLKDNQQSYITYPREIANTLAPHLCHAHSTQNHANKYRKIKTASEVNRVNPIENDESFNNDNLKWHFLPVKDRHPDKTV